MHGCGVPTHRCAGRVHSAVCVAMIPELQTFSKKEFRSAECKTARGQLFLDAIDVFLTASNAYTAEWFPRTLTDADGVERTGVVGLVRWVADHPEQQLIADLSGCPSCLQSKGTYNDLVCPAPPRTKEFMMDIYMKAVELFQAPGGKGEAQAICKAVGLRYPPRRHPLWKLRFFSPYEDQGLEPMHDYHGMGLAIRECLKFHVEKVGGPLHTSALVCPHRIL